MNYWTTIACLLLTTFHLAGAFPSFEETPFLTIKIKANLFGWYDKYIMSQLNEIYKDIHRCFNAYQLEDLDGNTDIILYRTFQPQCDIDEITKLKVDGDTYIIFYPNDYYDEDIKMR